MSHTDAKQGFRGGGGIVQSFSKERGKRCHDLHSTWNHSDLKVGEDDVINGACSNREGVRG